MQELPIFPNYMQLRERSRVPMWTWRAIRVLSVASALGLVLLLFLRPELGLRLMWGLVIPVLPLIFLVAPGIWRNVCPLAAVNQTPRVLSFTRELTLPPVLQEYGYVLGFTLFFAMASSRKWLFNESGPASGLLLLGLLVAAFLGGLVFKGKSGWCSSMCPLLPVQRMYNQTPFLTIGNSHCESCVGCNKNCYDFNPKVANLADLYDDDPYYGNYRKFFMGVFPGFVLAFFLVPNPPSISIGAMYVQILIYMLVSVGSLFTLDALVKVTAPKITTLFGALAINLFYWFGFPGWMHNVAGIFGLGAPESLVWLARAGMLALTAVWVLRSYRKEPIFLRQLVPTAQARVSISAATALRSASHKARLEVRFLPSEQHVVTDPGHSLLEVAERNEVPIESGCRMGVCGADPVVVLKGLENLAEMGDDERSTLERLGLGGNCRMACMARVNGPVQVTTDLKQAEKATVDSAGFEIDPDLRHIVIVGNGIAGVTAADYARRYHPDCEIDLIGREPHQLYNRMAISRLVYGRSAMSGLYLQPDEWFEENRITTWLNTLVSHVDSETRRVVMATGDSLPYDRLILATGSHSFVPPMEGFGLPGTFVLREADDAIRIRAFAQQRRGRHAVVAGGGLLGLEAAYALHKLGMDVTVLERGPWLLRRQLDQRGAEFLQRYLEALGLRMMFQTEVAAVEGNAHVQQLRTKDGLTLPCDVLLVAVGIRSNLDLAEGLELSVNRGVVVDEQMRSSDPSVFAVGDACEFDGRVMGLWSVAVEQGKVAAINAVGGEMRYEGIVPVTALKVVGVELTSMGQFQAVQDGDVEIALEQSDENRYRKLVIRDGRIVGAILLGYPLDAPGVTNALKKKLDIRPHLDALTAGDWQVLAS